MSHNASAGKLAVSISIILAILLLVYLAVYVDRYADAYWSCFGRGAKYVYMSPDFSFVCYGRR